MKLQKLALAAWFTIFSLFISVGIASAQSALPNNIPPTSPVYTDLLVYNLFHTFSCLAIGSSVIGQPCLTYKITKNAEGAIQSVPYLSQANLSGGLLGVTGSLITTLYTNPPLRTGDYLASVGQDLGFVKDAHAQVFGSGANVLSPIFSLWQASRNISYILLVLIFVIIGLMVMFRQKINPQTVITAQAALPGLVIGLILITFSFFIAALISDMAFIGINLVGYYFSAAQGNATQNLVTDMFSQNILTLLSKFVGVISSGDISHILNIIFNSVNGEVQNFLRFMAGLMAYQIGNQIGHVVPVVGDLAGIVVGLLGSAGTAAAAPEVFGLVLSWVAIAVLIFTMFKVLLRLINSYLTIIFLTISAPFHFLAASLPGRQGLATGWILNMLANILVFPAVMAVLYFVAYLLGKNNPPFIITSQVGITGGNTLPLLGGLDTGFINIILAFGALVALPAIPDIVVKTIGEAGAAGQMLGQELSGNIRGGQGYSNGGQRIGAITGSMGQDYSHFRGQDPSYSPSTSAGLAGKTIPRWVPFLKGKQPLGPKKNG